VVPDRSFSGAVVPYREIPESCSDAEVELLFNQLSTVKSYYTVE
jgi:hypothetical protein